MPRIETEVFRSSTTKLVSLYMNCYFIYSNMHVLALKCEYFTNAYQV